MALGSQPRWTVRPAAGVQVDIDVGLRDYMLRIYNYMASGLALTGIVAYVFAQSGYYAQLAQTPLIYLVMLAPLGLVQAIGSTTTLFVFAFGVVLSVFFPALGRENLSRRELTQKGLAAVLVAAGAVLVTL